MLSLLDLPSELIVAVARQATVSDALRLRLACKDLAKICDFLIKDRRHRLYLHPKSIQYAIDICSVPEWTQDITEVIVLGCSEPSMRTRDPSHMPDHRLDHHPWDQFPPVLGRQQIVTYQHLIDAEFNTFEHNYAPLLEGLSRLDNIQVLKYVGRATEPGFCAVSDLTVDAHAKSRDFWQSCFGGEDQPKLQWALRAVWWSDAHIFTSLLSWLSDKLCTIDIQQPMPVVRRYRERDIRGAQVSRQRALYRHPQCPQVTQVKLTAPGQEGWHHFLTNMLSTMPNVISLEVDIMSRIDEQQSMQWRRARNPIDANDLWEEDWNLILRFAFAELARASKVQRFVVRNHSQWPYSNAPGDMLQFFETHRRSLRHVEIHDVIPFHAFAIAHPDSATETSRICDPHRGMQDVAKYMTTDLQLETAILKISRARCVEECPDHTTVDGHAKFCRSYPVGSNWYHVRTFEKLAVALEIEEKDSAWDFAVSRPDSAWQKTTVTHDSYSF